MRINRGPTAVIFMCALASEAKAIIEHYRLRKIEQRPFTVFRSLATSVNEQSEFTLVVTGVGQNSMATALGWILADRACEDVLMINVGVAGHPDLDVGELGLVWRVQAEHALARDHYVPIVTKWKGHLISLKTVLAPQTFEAQGETTFCSAIDMEGEAFFASAKRLLQSEQIHSIKVISDNCRQSHEKVDSSMVEKLLRDQIMTIAGFVEQLVTSQRLGHSDTAGGEFIPLEDIVGDKHFSKSQSLQLQRLMHEARVREISSATVAQTAVTSSNAKDLLKSLRELLAAAPAPNLVALAEHWSKEYDG